MDSDSECELEEFEARNGKYPDQISPDRSYELYKKYGLVCLKQDLLLRNNLDYLFFGPDMPHQPEMDDAVFTENMIDKYQEDPQLKEFMDFGCKIVENVQNTLSTLRFEEVYNVMELDEESRYKWVKEVLEFVMRPIFFNSHKITSMLLRDFPRRKADISTVKFLITEETFEDLLRRVNISLWQKAKSCLPPRKLIKSWEFIACRVIYYLVLLASEIVRATWEGGGFPERKEPQRTPINPYPEHEAAKKLPPIQDITVDRNSTSPFQYYLQNKLLRPFSLYWPYLSIQRTASCLPNFLTRIVFENPSALWLYRRIATRIDELCLEFRDSDYLNEWEYRSIDDSVDLLEEMGKVVFCGEINGKEYDFYVPGLIQPLKQLFTEHIVHINRDILNEFHNRFNRYFWEHKIPVNSREIVQISECFARFVFTMSMDLLMYHFQIEASKSAPNTVCITGTRRPRPFDSTSFSLIRRCYGILPNMLSGISRISHLEFTKTRVPSLWCTIPIEREKKYLLETLLDYGVVAAIPRELRGFLTDWMLEIQHSMRCVLQQHYLQTTAHQMFRTNQVPSMMELWNFLCTVLAKVLNCSDRFHVFTGDRANFVLNTICGGGGTWKPFYVKAVDVMQCCDHYQDPVWHHISANFLHVIPNSQDGSIHLLVLVQIIRFSIQLAASTVRHVINTVLQKNDVFVGMFTGNLEQVECDFGVEYETRPVERAMTPEREQERVSSVFEDLGRSPPPPPAAEMAKERENVQRDMDLERGHENTERSSSPPQAAEQEDRQMDMDLEEVHEEDTERSSSPLQAAEQDDMQMDMDLEEGEILSEGEETPENTEETEETCEKDEIDLEFGEIPAEFKEMYKVLLQNNKRLQEDHNDWKASYEELEILPEAYAKAQKTAEETEKTKEKEEIDLEFGEIPKEFKEMYKTLLQSNEKLQEERDNWKAGHEIFKNRQL